MPSLWVSELLLPEFAALDLKKQQQEGSCEEEMAIPTFLNHSHSLRYPALLALVFAWVGNTEHCTRKKVVCACRVAAYCIMICLVYYLAKILACVRCSNGPCSITVYY